MPISLVNTRHIDPSDKPALRRWYRATRAVHDHDRPDAPFWTEDEAVALIRPDDPEERFVAIAAEDPDGTVTGAAIVFVPIEDNLDKAYFELSVVPEHRGSGVGDALMAQVLDAARGEGRSTVIGATYLPMDADETHPVRRFAARHGFAVANREVRRVLRLPVPDRTIQGWIDEAAPHHGGYAISTYVDDVPAELRPSFVELLNQLAVDAPTGDIDFEAGAMTVEVYEEQTRQRVATGRRVFVTVAVHDGAAVAHTTMSVPPPGEALPFLNQWGTYVHREHRGHRLGMAVKARNLLAVQAAHPERTIISTTNSPANAPMVAINQRMGFAPADVMTEFLRRL